ncbi:hypothetical protein H1C71_034441 [Ictidomys tridecemlineatus]|nr:hypothetical protein H1C71_034441 [Ictidomys tridecemlineatus]
MLFRLALNLRFSSCFSPGEAGITGICDSAQLCLVFFDALLFGGLLTLETHPSVGQRTCLKMNIYMYTTQSRAPTPTISFIKISQGFSVLDFYPPALSLQGQVQTTRDSPYALEPTGIIQSSQS